MAFILNNWTKILDPAPWTARRLIRCVSVGDYIYMTGGNTDPAGDRVAEVWRTDFGINWDELTSSPGWVARAAHGFVYFNGKFWIFGGSTASDFLNDIWSSDDCVTWTNEGNAAWSTRHEFGYCIHKGELYISGGYRSTGHLSDVWKTPDGINWTQVAVTIGLSHREHQLMSFLGNLYAYIGDNAAVSRRYVYRSTNDGATWSYLGEAAYDHRREHLAVIDDDGLNLAVVGGFHTGSPGYSHNDVWETSDGFEFTEISQISAFDARSDFGFVNHRGSLYIIGGTPDSGPTELADVWRSPLEVFVDFSGTPRVGAAPLSVTFTPEIVS